MSTVIVREGAVVVKDPADAKVYTFDWHTDNLATGVLIASTKFKITAVGSVGSDVEVAVTSITRSGTTATVTTTAAHGYATGDSITIAGALPTGGPSPSPYNGTFSITVTSTTAFTYTVSGSPATPATGTITAAAGIDNVSILAAAPYSSRYTQFRLAGGTLGALYEISNLIVTDESPAQTKERSFRVSIDNR